MKPPRETRPAVNLDGDRVQVMVRTFAVTFPCPAAIEFVTVTGRLFPVVAPAETVTRAVIVVALTTTTVLKETPLGPLSVAPVANPVPVNVAGTFVLPRATLGGLIEASVGAAITFRQFVHVAVEWSGLVTVTVYAPVGVPLGTLIVAVIVSDPLLTTIFDAFTAADGPVITIFAPLTKPEPENVTLLDAPTATWFGLSGLTGLKAGGYVAMPDSDPPSTFIV